MTPETFLNEFKHLTNAPGGVTHLRETVLALAMRGELTKSTETDSAYAPDFEAARNWLAANAKELSRSRWRNSESVQLEEQPFALPKNWIWARVNDTGLYTNGLAFKPSDWCDSGTPIIRIQNLTNPGKPLNHARGDFPRSVTVEPGDLLVSWSATLAAFVWRGREAVLNQHIYRVEPCPETVRKQFLFWLLTWAIKRMATSEAAHGLVMTHINRGPFLAFPIPLPPLDEQDRIASKIDELMTLCDDLEAHQTESRRVQRNLCQSALQRLGDANNPTERARNWTFVHNAFPDLITRPENIRELRKTILQLAVTGHLVPQNPNDEPARHQIDGSGCSSLDPSDQVHCLGEKLPTGWEWVTLRGLGQIIGGGTPSKSRSDFWGGPVPWVRPKDMKTESIADTSRHLSKKALDETSVRLIPAPALLVVTRGMILAHSFPVARTETDVTINQDMKALIPRAKSFLPFLALACRGHAQHILGLVERSSHGTCRLSTTRLFDMPFGLPPLAEQKRIVAKVDELMSLCDRLEQQLTEAETTAQTLAATATATFTTTDNTRTPPR